MSKEVISTLNNIIRNDLLLRQEKGIFFVIETDKLATCKEFTIKKEKVSTFGFSIDVKRKKGEGDPIFPFFNSSQAGICSKNDAILIGCKSDKLYVFLIDLKSSSNLEYLPQLKSARDFVNYLFAVLKTHFDIVIELNFFGLRVLPSNPSKRKKRTGRQKFQFQNRQGLQVADYVEPHRSLSLIDLIESAEQISS